VIDEPRQEHAGAQEALRQSEERYRALTHLLTSVIWRADASGAFVSPQPEWSAFTGQAWEASQGWGWLDALHPDDREEMQARWRRAVAAGSVYEARGRVWYAPGREFRHFVARAAPLRDAAGAIREWICTLTDTHDQELRERDARLLADVAESVRRASDRAEILARAAELIADYMQVRRCLIVDIDVAADQARVLAECCRGAPSVPHEYHVSSYSPLARAEMERGATIINHDAQIDPRTAATYAATYEPAGERAYLAVPLMRDGHWNGTLWISDDVPRAWQEREVALLETVAERVWLASEKLRAEQARRAYAEQLVALNRSSVAIHAASTVAEVLQQITEHARVVLGAHLAVTVLTVDAEPSRPLIAMSRSDQDAAPDGRAAPADPATILALVGATNQPLRLTQAELAAHPAWGAPGRAANGRSLPRGLLAAPLTTPSGHTLGVVQVSDKAGGDFSATDEAVLVQLCQIASVALENARLYAAAQDAVHVRDQFLSVAAHELKTPLTALLGYGQTLLRRVVRESSLGERDQRLLRQTTEQALRLNRLIDALLDVSRIETGRLSIERRPLDLSGLLQRMVEAVRPTLEQHTLALSGADAPVLIEGDELRLEQVVQNLISNAVKYSPDGGSIQIGLADAGAHVRLTVRDEGIGIPPAAISQLFQRFFRVAEADTRHISGMGIGLYVVKEIVGLHGGTVAVESAEGRGSTFTISLPRDGEPAAAAAAPAGDSGHVGRSL